jgi:hypothetical protein
VDNFVTKYDDELCLAMQAKQTEWGSPLPTSIGIQDSKNCSECRQAGFCDLHYLRCFLLVAEKLSELE